MCCACAREHGRTTRQPVAHTSRGSETDRRDSCCMPCRKGCTLSTHSGRIPGSMGSMLQAHCVKFDQKPIASAEAMSVHRCFELVRVLAAVKQSTRSQRSGFAHFQRLQARKCSACAHIIATARDFAGPVYVCTNAEQAAHCASRATLYQALRMQNEDFSCGSSH